MIRTAARQSAALGETGHRPWPLPDEPWLQSQTLESQLFAHWAVPPEQLGPHVPHELQLDVRDGAAWIGLTAFRVSAARLRGTLPVPLVSGFLELNLRTYVSREGRPGIWFLGLDASSRLAVVVARRTHRLPFHRARMRMERREGWIELSSAREGEAGPCVFEARYRAAGEAFTPEPGSLEHFLTERYRLYASRGAAAEIHHPPWSLRPAEAELVLNTMAPAGVELAGEPLLHYAERLDVLIWPLRPA